MKTGYTEVQIRGLVITVLFSYLQHSSMSNSFIETYALKQEISDTCADVKGCVTLIKYTLMSECEPAVMTVNFLLTFKKKKTSSFRRKTGE